MRIIVTAGGTGGHIYPAINFIKNIKAEILFIGTSDRMEKDICKENNIRFKSIKIRGLNRKNVFKNIVVFKEYLKAKKDIKRIIKEFKPDKVIGFGGYVTLPVLKVAQSLGIDTYLHEQNVIVGLSNKLISKKCKAIFISFKETKKVFNKKLKVIYTGNPTAYNLYPETKKNIYFNNGKKNILIAMGSLGSMTINRKLSDMLKDLSKLNYNFTIVSGKNYFDLYKNTYENIKILPYIDNLKEYLSSYDLFISRAGATTIAEITALNIVTLFIPSPYVTHNHQYLNAKSLYDCLACELLEEKDFNFDNIKKILDKLKDEKYYNLLKTNIGKYAKRNSIDIIKVEMGIINE